MDGQCEFGGDGHLWSPSGAQGSEGQGHPDILVLSRKYLSFGEKGCYDFCTCKSEEGQTQFEVPWNQVKTCKAQSQLVQTEQDSEETCDAEEQEESVMMENN